YERMTRHGGGYSRLSLAPIERLLDEVGRPESAFPSIHVTGTKGKGSTSTIAAAILERIEGAVGLYTSPHLERLTQGIRLSGTEISESEWVEGLERLRPAWTESVESLDEARRPTFFDVVTALAFHHFRSRGVRAAVVEVGLGGRLHSTNLVDTRVGAITNHSLYHTETPRPRPPQVARGHARSLPGPRA